jgi:PAS domain S-box-containing protein
LERSQPVWRTRTDGIAADGSAAHGTAADGRELRAALDCVKDYAIFLLDVDGRVATWNAGAAALKGYSGEEIAGRHFSAFYTEEDRAAGRPARLLDDATRDGRVEDEGWRVRKDGTRFWADVVISAVRDEDGRLRGFLKVTRDLTERRRAEMALAAGAAQQATVAELGLDALGTLDLATLLEHATARVAATLGVDVATVSELAPGGEALVLRAASGLVGRAGADGGAPLSDAVRGWGPGALTREGVVASALLPDQGVVSDAVVVIAGGADGAPFGLLGAHSRTPRTFGEVEQSFLIAVAHVLASAIGRGRLDARLRETTEAAQEERIRNTHALEAMRERDEFIAVAAHELRTPLTVLRLKLERLRGAAPGVEGAAGAEVAAIEAATRHVRRLSVLVDRLVDVSRIASGRLELHREDVELGALVERALGDARAEAGASGCALSVSAPSPVVVSGDRARLESVFALLVSNAVKYGRGRPVEIAVDAAGGRARVAVRDSGIGISPEAQRRLFQRFQRAAPSRYYGGLGLGLYVARHVVEAHGGQILLSSAPGEGATFTVELPAAEGSAA